MLKRILAVALTLVMCLSMAAFAEETDKDARIAELEAQVEALNAQVNDLLAKLAATNYVAAFDGGYVTVDEAMAEYEYIEYMMSAYGYSMDGYEDYYKQDIANTMLQDKIVQFKAQELGLTTPTSEQEIELRAAAEENLNMYIETYRADFEAEDKDETQVLAETIQFLTENGVTSEMLYEQELTYFAANQLFEYVVKDVAVTDEDVKAEFDSLVAADEANYADAYYYENALMSGATVYWHPEGFRNVRQVLVAFDDDQSTRYDEITGRISDFEAELEAAQAPAEEESSEETEETEGEAEAPRAVEAIEADIAAANAELDALYNELMPVADEVTAKFNEGVAIDELIATYGGDPGSINDDGTTNTYAVSADSASYDSAFVEAAMSVSEIGGLSAPTRGMYGLYIVYYDSDVVSGAVDYETVKDDLYYTVLDNLRNETYDAQIEAWLTELNAVFYLENFR